MRNPLYLILIFLTIAIVGCSDSDKFVIEGEIENSSAVNVRVLYYYNGRLSTGITATADGKFMFEGVAPKRAIVELYDNDYRLMGRTTAMNGERLVVKLKPSKPYEISVKGSELAERWANLLNEKADSLLSDSKNKVIANYVIANPANELAGLLLITEFNSNYENAALADSLWNLLSPESRPDELGLSFKSLAERFTTENLSKPVADLLYLASGNRRDTFKIADHRLSLIAISNDNDHRDSIVSMLWELEHLRKKEKFEILDLSVDNDTLLWRRSVLNDSATWVQGWAAGSIAGRTLNPLRIPEIPYFIVADSVGTQLWRGKKPADAKEFILNYYD